MPGKVNGSNSIQAAILVCLGVVVVTGVVGAVRSKDNAVQIIGFCSMISVSLVGMLQSRRAEIKADAVAVKVEEVAVENKEIAAVADKKLDAIAETSEKVHTLVNNRMGIALSAVAEALRWKANNTKLQVDYDNADKADTELDEHNKKQAIVDAEIAAKSQVSALTSVVDKLESHQIAVITCTSDEIIREWSPAATTLLGWSKEDMVGQHVSMIVPPRFRGAHLVAFRKAVEEHRGPLDPNKQYELYGMTKEGIEIPIYLHLSGWQDPKGNQMYSAAIERREETKKV